MLKVNSRIFKTNEIIQHLFANLNICSISVAKRKSLFDDRSAEIQELTYIIKGDLSSLNQQIAHLQEISKKQRHTTNGKHLQSHSSSVVLALQSKLATMSTDFKQILEVRTENLKQQKNRREQFSQSAAPVPVVRNANQGSILLQVTIEKLNIYVSKYISFRNRIK